MRSIPAKFQKKNGNTGHDVFIRAFNSIVKLQVVNTVFVNISRVMIDPPSIIEHGEYMLLFRKFCPGRDKQALIGPLCESLGLTRNDVTFLNGFKPQPSIRNGTTSLFTVDKTNSNNDFLPYFTVNFTSGLQSLPFLNWNEVLHGSFLVNYHQSIKPSR